MLQVLEELRTLVALEELRTSVALEELRTSVALEELPTRVVQTNWLLLGACILSTSFCQFSRANNLRFKMKEDHVISPSDKILVTGSNGFIGAKVVESLLEH